MDVRAEWETTPQGRAIMTLRHLQGRGCVEGRRRQRHAARVPRRHDRRHDDGSRRHAHIPRRPAQRAVCLRRRCVPPARWSASGTAACASSATRAASIASAPTTADRSAARRKSARSAPNYMLSMTPMRLSDLAAAVRGRVLRREGAMTSRRPHARAARGGRPGHLVLAGRERFRDAWLDLGRRHRSPCTCS